MASATANRCRKLEYQRVDGTRQVLTSKRLIETLTNLVERGEQGVSSLTNLGLRLSHYIFVLRTEYGLPIHMERVAQPGGVGWYGRYTLREKIKILPSETTKPAGCRASERASIPMTANGELGRLSDDG